MATNFDDDDDDDMMITLMMMAVVVVVVKVMMVVVEAKAVTIMRIMMIMIMMMMWCHTGCGIPWRWCRSGGCCAREAKQVKEEGETIGNKRQSKSRAPIG